MKQLTGLSGSAVSTGAECIVYSQDTVLCLQGRVHVTQYNNMFKLGQYFIGIQ